MAKNKRRNTSSSKSSMPNKKQVQKNEDEKDVFRPNSVSKQKPKPRSQAHAKTTIPFHAQDDVLLLGEGDFSFALSLATNYPHCFRSLTATTLETREVLEQKYPQAVRNVDLLLSHNAPSSLSPQLDRSSPSSTTSSFTDLSHSSSPVHDSNPTDRVKVHYTTSATALTKPPSPFSSRHHPARTRGFQRIAFNFPHVGGLSTDVRRQIRANQALLAGYFREAGKFLALSRSENSEEGDEDRDDFETPGAPSVLVTIFEGEPYSLWNVKDVARSEGLALKRSWRFEWGIWEGYRHARTLGNIVAKGKRDGEREGDVDELGNEEEERRGWKGEEREARTYEFVRKEDAVPPGQGKKKRKRTGGDDSD